MKDMKNNKTAAFFLGLILVGSALSCKMFGGGASSSAGTNTAVTCPTTTLAVNDLMGYTGQISKESVGCTVTFKGELREVNSKSVKLADPATYTSEIECAGDFSGDTYRQIGAKLDNLNEKSPGTALPVATFSAKIVSSSSIGYVLGNCRMTDYGK